MYLNKDERAAIEDYIQLLEYRVENCIESSRLAYRHKLEIMQGIHAKALETKNRKSKQNYNQRKRNKV